jgi:hypothetical protein
MHDKLQLLQKATAIVTHPTDVVTDLNMSGKYVVEHWRNGQRINEYHFPNGIVDEGKNQLLNVQFHAQGAISAWFMGLIDNAGWSSVEDDDAYIDIDGANGWAEFALYTDAGNGDSATTRPAWDEGSASGQSITNSSVTVFDITGPGTVKGLFLVGGPSTPNIKGNSSSGNTLWATALFSGDVAVLNGDQLKATYTVSA